MQQQSVLLSKAISQVVTCAALHDAVMSTKL